MHTCNLCIQLQIANLQCNLCIHLCIHFHIYKSTLQLMHTIANANHACRLVRICWPVLRPRAAACALAMNHDLFTKCRIFSFQHIFNFKKSNVNCQQPALNAIALCCYPNVKVEFRDSSQICTTAPIFMMYFTFTF